MSCIKNNDRIKDIFLNGRHASIGTLDFGSLYPSFMGSKPHVERHTILDIKCIKHDKKPKIANWLPPTTVIYKCSWDRHTLRKLDEGKFVKNVVQMTIVLYELGFPMILELWSKVIKYNNPGCISLYRYEQIVNRVWISLKKIECHPNRKNRKIIQLLSEQIEIDKRKTWIPAEPHHFGLDC